jgi:hypothetical protein
MQNLSPDSLSVQSYLNILQQLISRMATNSTTCKTWCVTLVSAVVVVVADKGKPSLVWVPIIPIVLFFFLDSYYLGLERQFRALYENFIRKLQKDDGRIGQEVFVINPGFGLDDAARAFFSISTWPFYSLQLVMLIIINSLI